MRQGCFGSCRLRYRTSGCVEVMITLILAAGCSVHAQPGADIGISPSGHYVTYKGRTLLLVGDSG
ncbi:MAG: hypothetical protein ACUVXJ_09985, partial [Phycisphaerae bacterium]